MRRTTPITYQGRTLSIYAWAKELGFKYGTLRRRIRFHGDDLDSVFGDELKSRPKRMVTFNGVTKACHEWAREFSIPKTTLYARLNGGWPIEKALNTPVQQHARHGYRRRLEFEGRSLTIGEWAKEKGIAKTVIYLRLGYGWSVERTLTTPVKTMVRTDPPRHPRKARRKERVVLSFRGKSISEWAAISGVSTLAIYKRIREGWSIERAMTTSKYEIAGRPKKGRATAKVLAMAPKI